MCILSVLLILESRLAVEISKARPLCGMEEEDLSGSKPTRICPQRIYLAFMNKFIRHSDQIIIQHSRYQLFIQHSNWVKPQRVREVIIAVAITYSAI